MISFIIEKSSKTGLFTPILQCWHSTNSFRSSTWNIKPVVAAIINADTIINNALIPKNPNSNTVIGRFDHGDANRNATTEEVFTPFL